MANIQGNLSLSHQYVSNNFVLHESSIKPPHHQRQMNSTEVKKFAGHFGFFNG